MSNHSRSHSKSELLSTQENESILNVLGKGCFSLATCVAQLYVVRSARKRHTKWTKKCCGAVCFVKDNRKRSYFIRIYDPVSVQMLWEQELYTKFKYNAPTEFFHTFEAHDCHVGLNFASEDEAALFKEVIGDKLMERNKKRQEREQKRQETENANTESTEQSHDTEETLKESSNLPSGCDEPKIIENMTAEDGRIQRKSVKSRRKKLTKDDVGIPSDFRHVSHMSWNMSDGPHMDRLDSEMKGLLGRIGIKERAHMDKDTMDFIYDFVDRHGGVSAVQEDFETFRMADLSDSLDETVRPTTLAVPESPSPPSLDILPPGVPSLPPTTTRTLSLDVRQTPVAKPLPHPRTRTKPPLPTSKPPTHQTPLAPLNQNTTNISLCASNSHKEVVNQAETSAGQQKAITSNVASVANETTEGKRQSDSQVSSNDVAPRNTYTTPHLADPHVAALSEITIPPPPPPPPPTSPPPTNVVPPNISSTPRPPSNQSTAKLQTHDQEPLSSNVSTPSNLGPPPAPLFTGVKSNVSPAKVKISDLLTEIQAIQGKHLKHVTSEKVTPERDTLLQEIRVGTHLRHVDNIQKPTPEKRGSIAAALISQLIKRKTMVQFSDNEDSSDEFDDEWDD